ncbi:hypothetical protein [Neoroseomonas lacus]|uniref:Uncharacterized protein n=1 Tax=Neoroseomonas lacus TaxID=287609 RepID=A0A917KJP4_9PROT|nr:hypothetical protein [Neoroseomonas lacus]GGJ13973.1 hypothetical protein GCM10011320_21490 [Neoroseomonas lacus]
MQIDKIEILPIGPEGELFQISDGELYALLETEGMGMPWDDLIDRATLHPDICDYMIRWLSQHGVLVGSPHPPHLVWDDLAHDVAAARLL